MRRHSSAVDVELPETDVAAQCAAHAFRFPRQNIAGLNWPDAGTFRTFSRSPPRAGRRRAVWARQTSIERPAVEPVRVSNVGHDAKAGARGYRDAQRTDLQRSFSPTATAGGSPRPLFKRWTSCAACPLRRQSAFIPQSAAEIDFIQRTKVDHRAIEAGAEIIYMGQEDAELFTLFEGWAFRHQTLPDGRRQILNFLLPGDLVGFQASLMTAAEHSVEALTDVQVCVFSRQKAWSIFAETPEVAYQLAWLGAREESLVDENLTSVGQRSARERMAALIIGLYRRNKHLSLVTDDSFFFPLTRTHLSDALGLSLVHTIKTWSYLRRAGVFSFEGQRLKLLNPRLTARMADVFEREWRQRPIL